MLGVEPNTQKWPDKRTVVMPPDPLPDSIARSVVPLLVVNSLPENSESASAKAGDNEQVSPSVILVDFGFYALNF